MSRGRYTVPKDGGGFPRRHRFRVDADLIAPAAFLSSRAEAFMEFVTRYWRPEGSTILLSPCSNVKPYPLSPINRKVGAAIKRAGAWGMVEWVFISDLLGPVPYKYTWVPPACCYDARPDEVPHHWMSVVRDAVKAWWRRVKGYFTSVLVFLPKRYLPLVEEILNDHEAAPTIIRYDIFHSQKSVEALLRDIIRNY